MVLVLSHGFHSDQVKRDNTALLLETDFESHAAEAVFDDGWEGAILALHDHVLKLFSLLRVLTQISKDGHRG